MDWIFENLQIIIVVAGAIAYWLNQRAREKAGEEADYDDDGIPERPARRDLEPRTMDGGESEQEERARRIREEIQRKIAERRGQSAPPPMPEPVFAEREPVFGDELSPFPPPLRPVEVPPPVQTREMVSAYAETEALERQRRLAEQLEQLQTQRRDARRAADHAFHNVHAPRSAEVVVAGARPLGVRGLGAELRDPRALRRAIVMREVLGPPVALR
jgi:hypothetical protein